MDKKIKDNWVAINNFLLNVMREESVNIVHGEHAAMITCDLVRAVDHFRRKLGVDFEKLNVTKFTPKSEQLTAVVACQTEIFDKLNEWVLEPDTIGSNMALASKLIIDRVEALTELSSNSTK